LTSFLLAVPAFGLAVAGGALGIDAPAGLGLVGGGILYLLIHVLMIMPKLEGRSGAGSGGPEQVLLRALDMHDISEVGTHFTRAVRNVLGPTRAYLLAARPSGGEI
jgi:hypothetical protein